ncbi:MAG: dTDP-4-dehydrorhamnose reductase [Ignavibacteriae bacterium]|nr:MAG: dTDP-4-dehydrorhamnose reductase [Ignavibacteriota bacterium]
MRKILIVGSNGLLGQKISKLFSLSKMYKLLNASIENESYVDNIDYTQLDVTNRKNVLGIVEDFEPEVIINTAAVTNVDYCETNKEIAWRVNVKGVENLIYAAKFVDAKIIHFSSDYVFDGRKGSYVETDVPNPVSYYGRTKLASENVLKLSGLNYTIIRTMILYGVGKNVKDNFAIWVYKNLKENKIINVVDDQFGNPTLVDDLAYAVMRVVEYNRDGLYHIAGSEIVSRYNFALQIANQFGFDKKLIIPIKTAVLKQPAPRPLKSGFVTLKAVSELGIKMSNVEDGVRIFAAQLQNYLNEQKSNQ